MSRFWSTSCEHCGEDYDAEDCALDEHGYCVNGFIKCPFCGLSEKEMKDTNDTAQGGKGLRLMPGDWVRLTEFQCEAKYKWDDGPNYRVFETIYGQEVKRKRGVVVPIPLTPETLDWFPHRRLGRRDSPWIIGGCIKVKKFRNGRVWVSVFNCRTSLVNKTPAQHVHELQQLHLALTGEPLERKYLLQNEPQNGPE